MPLKLRRLKKPVGCGKVKEPVKLGNVPVKDGKVVGACASRISMDDTGGAGIVPVEERRVRVKPPVPVKVKLGLVKGPVWL